MGRIAMAIMGGILCTSCITYRLEARSFTRAGAQVASYDQALLATGAEDLHCARVSHAVVPINASCSRGSCSASVDVVDGCGRRIAYGKACTRVEQREQPADDPQGQVIVIATSCHPSPIGFAELGPDPALSDEEPSPPPAQVPRAREQPSAALLSFDSVGARSSLGKIDLSGCRAAGLPNGYGHAQVTFVPAGSVARVIVDAPSTVPPAAADCVGERLAKAEVAPFVGRGVVVGTTFRVGQP